MQIVPLIVMGVTSILVQVAMLRQFLTVFSGNELVIGIILSVWLTAVAAGSFLGRKITSSSAFSLSFFLVAIFSQTMILSALFIRPALQLEFGETISLAATIISVITLLLPLCLLIGMQFPLAVSYERGNTSLVYGTEAVGSLAGGILFTFLLSGRVDLLTLIFFIGSMNILTAVLLAGERRFLILLIVPFMLYFASHKVVPLVAWKGGEVIERIESRYGEIMTVKTGSQMNVFSSGRFAFAYPDPQTEEMIIHTAMSLHPDPKTLLLIGGSPALIREALKYGITRIDFVEMDPKMIAISLGILTSDDKEKIRDRRVSIAHIDARRFVRNVTEPTYDLILLNLPEPSTAQVNRFYTIEFFREAKQSLHQEGLFLLSLPTSSGYIGRRMQILQGTIYNSLKHVFSHVRVSAEEYGLICGSEEEIQLDPFTLTNRHNRRSIQTEFFAAPLLSDIFSPLKISRVQGLLEKSREMNTDMKPAAYQQSLMLWLEAQKSTLAISLLQQGKTIAYLLIALVIFCGLILFRKRQVPAFSVFITGYTAMACTITLMLAYQALFGYIYEMIGLLTAVFMAGIAAGSYGMSRTTKPLPWMRAAGILNIALFLSAAFLLKSEALFFMLNFLTGMAAGAEFIAANQITKIKTAGQNAGRLYGIELTGSFFGALLTSLIIVPLLGIPISLLLVALLKIVAVSMLFFFSYENA